MHHLARQRAISIPTFPKLFRFVTASLVLSIAVIAQEPRCFFPDQEYHRPPRNKTEGLPPCLQLNNPSGFDLAFIEFDQRGDFWDRDQLAADSAAIKAAAKTGKNILLIEYVHGWHNNAHEGNPDRDPQERTRDVYKFRQLLGFLAQSPYVERLHYRVFGVYIGWRGEMVREDDRNFLTKPLWVAHNLSFYPEKHIGTDVGTMPMVTEAIFWLVHEARHASPGARTILIGHSFGAMVLENAMAQAVGASVAGTPYEGHGATGGSIYSPADLVLLLNSAADSMRAKGLEEMLSRIGSSAAHYVDRNRPLIISVTSTGDWATGKFFPLGTGLSNAFRHFRNYGLLNRRKLNPTVSQKYFATHTPGHNDYLRSHEVVVDSEQIAGSLPLPPLSPPDRGGTRTTFEKAFEENLAHPEPPEADGSQRTWRFRSVGKSGVCWSIIRAIPGANNDTPYWILQVPPSVIKYHSDIYNQQSLCLYAALFRIDSPVRAARIPAGPRLMKLIPLAPKSD